VLEGIGLIVSGMILGLTAGISPGPLLALMFSETIKHGRTEGIKVAIVPLITDLPIILVVMLLASYLGRHERTLGIISILGAVYLVYLGIENILAKASAKGLKPGRKNALKRGIVANLLNPHPYLFWLTIGVPMLNRSWNIDSMTAILFLLSFYVLLVGSKVVVALVLDGSKGFLSSRYYIHLVRVLGVVLIAFALTFLLDGLEMLGAV